MRRRKGRPVHGWVNLDKPVGPTSTQAIGRVRRLTGAARIGHAGTLDPLASGVLPIALGEATKTVPYIMDARKTYRFTVRWGEARSTDDAEGEIVSVSDHRPDAADIRAALPRFVGSIAQRPPEYSAIKIGGERAYALARAGTMPEMIPRQVDIHRFALVETIDADHAVLEVETGKGAYVRALARDLALQLGSFGHVAALRRLGVGRFRVEDAISLDFRGETDDTDALSKHVLPIETALDDIPALALSADDAQRLRFGQSVELFAHPYRDWLAELMARGRQPGIVLAQWQGHPVAMVRIDKAEAQPVRVFNFETQ
jgi:tRNA pseudouridine55 synthase